MAQAATAIAHNECNQSYLQYSDRCSTDEGSSFYRDNEIGDKSLILHNPSQPPAPTTSAVQQIRAVLSGVAFQSATQAQKLSQAIVQQALEMGQLLWRMQIDLKCKEYKAFLGVLGWASTKARKYINLAKTFGGFERPQLIQVELTTLLSLCANRYSSVVAQLREVQDITQQLVEQLIKENHSPRKPKQEHISGWKQNRAGGGRRYEVILHDENTGLLIEEQAEAEKILPQRVIAEAIALRAEHKLSSAQPNEHTSEKSQTVDIPDADNEKLARQLQESDCGTQPPKTDRSTGEQAPLAEQKTQEEDTQQLEIPAQFIQVGDRVEIASDRKRAELDGQTGVIKVTSAVGCVVEVMGKTVWFCTDELVLVSEEVPIVAESALHLAEENADFIDDINQEANSVQFNCLEAQQ